MGRGRADQLSASEKVIGHGNTMQQPHTHTHIHDQTSLYPGTHRGPRLGWTVDAGAYQRISVQGSVYIPHAVLSVRVRGTLTVPRTRTLSTVQYHFPNTVNCTVYLVYPVLAPKGSTDARAAGA